MPYTTHPFYTVTYNQSYGLAKGRTMRAVIAFLPYFNLAHPSRILANWLKINTSFFRRVIRKELKQIKESKKYNKKPKDCVFS